MTITSSTTTKRAATALVTPAPKARLGRLARDGAIAIVVASAATPAVAGIGHAAGVSLDVGGAPIPPAGFAMLTAVFSLVGLVLAIALARFARRPKRAFVRTTVVLTVLSLVPDAIVGAAVGTKLLLMLAHLVAALIVIPAIARRLP